MATATLRTRATAAGAVARESSRRQRRRRGDDDPDASSATTSARRRTRQRRPRLPISSALLSFLALAMLLITELPSIAPPVVFVRANTAAGTETLIGIVGRDFVLLGADSSVSQSIGKLTAVEMDKIAVLVDPFPEYYRSGGSSTSSSGDGGGQENEQRRLPLDRQHCVAAAAAGDAADADRLLDALREEAALEEYRNDFGIGGFFGSSGGIGGGGGCCDVQYVDCSSSSSTGPVGTGTAGIVGATTMNGGGGGGGGLSVRDVSHLARRLVWERLRTPAPLRVCLLLGGMILTTTASSSSKSATADAEEVSIEATAILQQQQPPLLFPSELVQRQLKDLALAVSVASSSSSAVAAAGRDDGDGEIVAVAKPPEEADLETAAAMRIARPQRRRLQLEPRLYWLDEYGSLQRVPYGSHGLASHFVMSILDNGYRPNMSLEDAVALMRKCFVQLQTRYVVNNSVRPCIKCVDEYGCRIIGPDDYN